MKKRSSQNDTPSTIFFIRRFKNTKVTFALLIITLTWSSLIPFLRWCSSRNKLFTPNPMLIIYTIFWQGHVCRNSILKNSKNTYTMNWRNKSNDKKKWEFYLHLSFLSFTHRSIQAALIVLLSNPFYPFTKSF